MQSAYEDCQIPPIIPHVLLAQIACIYAKIDHNKTEVARFVGGERMIGERKTDSRKDSCSAEYLAPSDRGMTVSFSVFTKVCKITEFCFQANVIPMNRNAERNKLFNFYS